MRKVTTAAAPFPADGCGLFEVPSHHALDHTEDPDHFVFMAIWISENVLRRVVPNVVDYSLS